MSSNEVNVVEAIVQQQTKFISRKFWTMMYNVELQKG